MPNFAPESAKMTTDRTICVCETLMPSKHPSFEKHDPDI